MKKYHLYDSTLFFFFHFFFFFICFGVIFIVYVYNVYDSARNGKEKKGIHKAFCGVCMDPFFGRGIFIGLGYDIMI